MEHSFSKKTQLLPILALIFTLILTSSGCSTIHFVNRKGSPEQTKTYQESRWYHIGILRLAEYSDSVNLEKRCEERSWTAVRVRQNAGQAVLSWLFFPVYEGWEVAYSCD